MNELTIIKRGDAAYIDSREVAEIIGKPHRHLLRDIRSYAAVIEKIGAPNFGLSDFFIETTYKSEQNKPMPCYLISKMGCQFVANKLIGEKGIKFTAAYVAKFNEMEQREREELKIQAATPRLQVFNTAVRNVLSGLNDTHASGCEIMSFLRGAYKPFGITVSPEAGKNRYTATDIARRLFVFSYSGLYHSHAISAIIEKLNVSPEHISIAPYGAVGIKVYYDGFILGAVEDWLADNAFPRDIPHLGFEYHVHYDIERAERALRERGRIKAEYNDGWFDGDDEEDFTDEMSKPCALFDTCDDCPCRNICRGED